MLRGLHARGVEGVLLQPQLADVRHADASHVHLHGHEDLHAAVPHPARRAEVVPHVQHLELRDDPLQAVEQQSAVGEDQRKPSEVQEVPIAPVPRGGLEENKALGLGRRPRLGPRVVGEERPGHSPRAGPRGARSPGGTVLRGRDETLERCLSPRGGGQKGVEVLLHLPDGIGLRAAPPTLRLRQKPAVVEELLRGSGTECSVAFALSACRHGLPEGSHRRLQRHCQVLEAGSGAGWAAATRLHRGQDRGQ
mmetsp:Transcript_62458/g.182562  ORF Transcript_62458/g.182562 Transcript_62458/m.182562 type:complete len:251 (-) Transcript_62458:237-989(-)